MNRPPVLLTRPAPGNAEFAAALRARLGGVEIIESPLQEIVLLEPGAWPGPEDALVFTSRNAVAALAARQEGGGRRAYCVGARTAEAARVAGFNAVAGGGAVELLPGAVAADPPAGALWYLHGVHRRGNLQAALAEKGLSCISAAVYDQRALPLSEEARARLAKGERIVAPLFSPRSAGLLAAEAENLAANLVVVALSEAVRAAWPGAATVAGRPDSGAMLEAVAAALG